MRDREELRITSEREWLRVRPQLLDVAERLVGEQDWDSFHFCQAEVDRLDKKYPPREEVS